MTEKVVWGERSEPLRTNLRILVSLSHLGFPYPEGILSPSPGLPRSGYPGGANKRHPTLKGLCPHLDKRLTQKWDTTPLA